MKINILFYIILVLSLYFFIRKKISDFLMLVLFFSPYIATTIINLYGVEINIAMFLGVVLIVKYLLFFAKCKIKYKLNKNLCIFYFLCFLSLFSFIYIKGDFFIEISKQKFLYSDLKYTLLGKQLFHFGYLTFCFIIYFITNSLVISNRNITKQKIEKIIIYSFYSIVGYCIIYYFMRILGKLELFNNLTRMNAAAGRAFIRLAGPNLEPSMFAIYLIFTFGILYYNQKTKALFLNIILGILSSSSTYILGVVIWILIIFSRKKKEDFKKLIILGFVIAILILLIMQMDERLYYYIFEIIEKIQGKGISGSDRKENMIFNLITFLNVPILGIGFAGVRSTDLFSNLLLNCGVVSFLFFIKAILDIKNKKAQKILGVVYFLEMISVPEIYYLYLWIYWGISDLKEKK